MLVPTIGTNDGASSGVAATYSALVERAYDAMQRSFPNARIVAVKPAVQASHYANIATVNTATATAIAARPTTRAIADAASPATSDNLHPTPAFYAAQGAAIFAAFAALP